LEASLKYSRLALKYYFSFLILTARVGLIYP
jgi:hypothetical protein